MASGMEMMISAFVKNLPEGVRDTIANVGQISVEVRNQMHRIEANQKLIMQHLGIEAGQENGITAGNSGDGGTAIQKRN